MSKSLNSQNSEDSRLIFVRNWMTQPRQLLIPSQSPLCNNLISLMCLLMQNWSYFCRAYWLDWISLIIKRIEWIRNFKHLLLITPPGAHCPVNRADHVCSALQHDLLPADPDRQRLSSLLHPEVSTLYIYKLHIFNSPCVHTLYWKGKDLTSSETNYKSNHFVSTRCIERGKSEADPNPNFHMIWKVFPYMLTQVSNSLKSQIKVFPYVFT